MVELVPVSKVEQKEELKKYLEDLIRRERYVEAAQAIGMHSLLIDPQHTMSDQASLYRFVLGLIKNRIKASKGKDYAAWYAEFPKLLDRLISGKTIPTDAAAADVVASHRDGYGLFKSVDDFFFWALDDRRLPLDQIVAYIEKTV
jgi:hypothetical protein